MCVVKLLDNHWEILLARRVDGRYCAAAKKPGREKWKDIFELVDSAGIAVPLGPEMLEMDPPPRPRKLRRIADGVTPDEALAKLVDQVLGLSATP